MHWKKLLKYRLLAFTTRFLTLEKGMKICISNMFPVNADNIYLRVEFQELLF